MHKLIGLLVGAVVLAGCGGVASTPGSSKGPAVATVAPTVAPPASTPGGATAAAAAPLRDGPLPAGTYSVLRGAATLEVPAGWEGCCGAFGIIKSDVVALLFDDITDVIVYADSCHWKAGPNPEPKGAPVAAAAFSSQAGHQGTRPAATTVAGRPGWRVQLTVPVDQAVTKVGDNNSFTGCDDGTFATWGLKGLSEPSRYQQVPGQIDTLFLVDVGARTYVADVVTDANVSTSDQAQLDAMLASLAFK